MCNCVMEMGARNHKKKSQGPVKETQPLSRPPPPLTLHTIISAVLSPQGLNQRNMKLLYALLVRLSLNKAWSNCESALSHGDWKLGKLKFEKIHALSDFLFQELDSRFEEFFCALHNVSATRGSGRAALLMDICANRQELMLLLRCCLVLLILTEFSQKLLSEKKNILLSILSRLISIELSGVENEECSIIFKSLISLECAYVDGDCTASVTEEFAASISSLERSNSCYTLLCGVLEVFADELLVHESLREYFMLIDSASSKSGMLLNVHFDHGNFGSVLEVICAHFVLSLLDERAFIHFDSRLFWCHKEDIRIPEISLPAALPLLLDPVVLSAPKMFQAHLVLLVSEAVSISDSMMLDLQLMDWHSKAFESSIILYTRHVSSLHIENLCLSGNGSFVKSCLFEGTQLTFESLLLQSTVDKLHHLIAKSENLWNSYLSSMSFGTNSDLVAASIAYVKETLCVFDASCKDEMLSILGGMILGCSSDDLSSSLFHTEGEPSPHDIYLLASILKLMSSSMLQTLRYATHAKFSDCLNSLGDASSCKEVDRIVHILGCFRQFNIHLPIQNFLSETMQSYPVRHKESKWMLFHLSGLLSFSYISRIDFLVKGCLFMIMTLLNLFVIEEGDLSALGALFGRASKFFFRSDNFERDLVVRKSSQVISSKIQKIHDMHIRTCLITSSHKRKQNMQAETAYSSLQNDQDSAVVDNAEQTCNGAVYLNCMLSKNSESDFDDLADFIVCKQGKDYHGWLRDRQRYRKWKHKKMTSLRWKKKKMAWKSLKSR